MEASNQKQFMDQIEQHQNLVSDAIGNIVETTKKVEGQLERLLRVYINPKDEKRKLLNVILSNHFLNLGKKVQLFGYINVQEEWLTGTEKEEFFSKFRSIMRTRNAFAHYHGASSSKAGPKDEADFNYKVEYFNQENFYLMEHKETKEQFQENCRTVLDKIASILSKLHSS